MAGESRGGSMTTRHGCHLPYCPTSQREVEFSGPFFRARAVTGCLLFRIFSLTESKVSPLKGRVDTPTFRSHGSISAVQSILGCKRSSRQGPPVSWDGNMFVFKVILFFSYPFGDGAELMFDRQDFGSKADGKVGILPEMISESNSEIHKTDILVVG